MDVPILEIQCNILTLLIYSKIVIEYRPDSMEVGFYCSNKGKRTMIRVLIGGDVCPIGRNLVLFQDGEARLLFNDLLPVFENADMKIVCLECPLIRDLSPIKKMGPVLGVPTDVATGLKTAGIDVVNLANNHIMDHGPDGLLSTIEALRESGINHFGAGESMEKARRIWIREIRGMRIGVIGLAEHEFGIAQKNKPGGNPLDVIDFVRNVKQHRSEFDYLIALVHGNNELYQYPRPELIDTCRFLVEQGANAVICQHSHCVGCMETYLGAPILYGQGNLLFDMPAQPDIFYEGVLVSLNIKTASETHVELIPYRQSDGQPGAYRMSPVSEEKFLNELNNRSKSIGNESFVYEQWDIFCRKNKRFYLSMLHGKPNLLRRVLGKLDMLHYLDSPQTQRKRLHMIRCESLREGLLMVLSMEAERKE